MTGRRLFKLMAVLLMVFALMNVADFVQACVGRKLVLGSVDDTRNSIVARILSILVNERTGTTVEIKFFSDEAKLYEMVRKDKVDLFVGYVENFAGRLENAPDGLSMQEKFNLVKKKFAEEENLVWLKPMGFSGRTAGGDSLGWASTVIRKDTLKKFPALPRLIAKIGTKVVLDDDLMESLEKKVPTSKPARVARDFLKEKKLI